MKLVDVIRGFAPELAEQIGTAGQVLTARMSRGSAGVSLDRDSRAKMYEALDRYGRALTAASGREWDPALVTEDLCPVVPNRSWTTVEEQRPPFEILTKRLHEVLKMAPERNLMAELRHEALVSVGLVPLGVSVGIRPRPEPVFGETGPAARRLDTEAIAIYSVRILAAVWHGGGEGGRGGEEGMGGRGGGEEEGRGGEGGGRKRGGGEGGEGERGEGRGGRGEGEGEERGGGGGGGGGGREEGEEEREGKEGEGEEGRGGGGEGRGGGRGGEGGGRGGGEGRGGGGGKEGEGKGGEREGGGGREESRSEGGREGVGAGREGGEGGTCKELKEGEGEWGGDSEGSD